MLFKIIEDYEWTNNPANLKKYITEHSNENIDSQRDGRGATALTYACGYNNITLAFIFAYYGANKYECDVFGVPAIRYSSTPYIISEAIMISQYVRKFFPNADIDTIFEMANDVTIILSDRSISLYEDCCEIAKELVDKYKIQNKQEK